MLHNDADGRERIRQSDKRPLVDRKQLALVAWHNIPGWSVESKKGQLSAEHERTAQSCTAAAQQGQIRASLQKKDKLKAAFNLEIMLDVLFDLKSKCCYPDVFNCQIDMSKNK